jgi:flagellar biogenesis protein FliO
LVKKFGKKIPMLNSDIKICSMAAISNNAKLVLIDIKGNSLLVGVTNQKINLIKDFSGQIKLPKTPVDSNIKQQFSNHMHAENKNNVEVPD